MKILVVGSGAREHALVWKLSQSKMVSKIYCAPGNGGIEDIAQCVNIKSDDINTLVNFALKEEIDLTVVGPEDPLVLGIVDKFNDNGLRVFGPDKACSFLEGSKVFAKEFMLKYNIPTAKYKSYSNINSALKGLEEFSYPLVIKADGLAGGKGVIICKDFNESKVALVNMMEECKFKRAGEEIIIEEYLDGVEGSLLCFVSNNNIIPMESARDYKKVYDGDLGPNTGGMGCFSPNPIFNKKLIKNIEKEILNNIEIGLKKEDLIYNGVLFIGLMITANGPKVLEFNVRMGDPETEVILPRLNRDIVEILIKTIEGTLKKEDLIWSNKSCLTLISASGGYPLKYKKNQEILMDKLDDGILVFHGGTKKEGTKLKTNGGRVLAVTALGDTLKEVREKVYKNIKKISYKNMYYRNDIGKG